MTYKYKDDVKRVLFEQQRVEQNPSVLNTAFNMRDELNEVYRKAAAADKMDEYLLEKYNEYMNKAFKDDDRSLEFAKVLEESRRVGLEIILELEDEE